jgi:hypothetical protein
MKRLVILGAVAAAVMVGGVVVKPTLVIAGTKESCRHHLVGADRTSGPARDAMIKRYQACLKAK